VLVPRNGASDNGAMMSPKRLLKPILNFMLPPRCPGCSAIVDDDNRFCAMCWSELRFLDDGGCVHCALPLGTLDGMMCATCLATPPSYDAVIAGVAYGPIASRIALRLKYARRPGLAHTIASVLVERVPKDALIVPVPLHRWRLWQRGFNQSLAIGQVLARRTALPVSISALRRSRTTPSMRGLNPAQRRAAVRGAFACDSSVAGKHVALIDDVLTTGATANACARALKKAGASRVTLICWARVLPEQ
jgi:ComF family protein